MQHIKMLLRRHSVCAEDFRKRLCLSGMRGGRLKEVSLRASVLILRPKTRVLTECAQPVLQHGEAGDCPAERKRFPGVLLCYESVVGAE